MHVDEFIDHGIASALGRTGPGAAAERYARWFFLYHRLSAVLRIQFREFFGDRTLFCDYEGKRYRVTGASRLGDVWLTTNFNQGTGYELRVDVEKCSGWAETQAAQGEATNGNP